MTVVKKPLHEVTSKSNPADNEALIGVHPVNGGVWKISFVALFALLKQKLSTAFASLEEGRLKKEQESLYKPIDHAYLSLSQGGTMDRDEALDFALHKTKYIESKLPAVLEAISISSNAPYDSMEGGNAVVSGTVVTFGIVGEYEGSAEPRIVPLNEVTFQVTNNGPGTFTGNAYTAPAVTGNTWVNITATHIPTGITADLSYPLLLKPATNIVKQGIEY